MEPIPLRTHESKPVNRRRWWIHLILITSYLIVLTVVGLARNKLHQPVLTSAQGLLF
jgi:hypothetical protein